MDEIYVECKIRAPFERLWRATQEPAQHQRWDLRFSRIANLPRASEREPQRFSYVTNIAFGLTIRGWGSSIATRASAGGATVSSLKFGSDDRKSLISAGSGYWKYQPASDGVIFSTSYDYAVRYGVFGRTVDRYLFRPLIHWATAYSFDTLRIWLERDLRPEVLLVRDGLRLSLGAVAVGALIASPRSRGARMTAAVGAVAFAATRRFVPSARRCLHVRRQAP